jgi:hypothetical protein
LVRRNEFADITGDVLRRELGVRDAFVDPVYVFLLGSTLLLDRIDIYKTLLIATTRLNHHHLLEVRTIANTFASI